VTLTSPSLTPHPTRPAVVVAFAIRPGADRSARERDARRVSGTRRLVRVHLTARGLHALVDDAELIVSELLTNSLVHSGGTGIRLVVHLEGDLLQIRVADGVRRSARSGVRPGEDAESGRGLELVDAVVRARKGAWGVSPDGTCTWCTLPVEGEGP